MKFLLSTAAIISLLLVILSASPGWADSWTYHHRRHHQHVTLAEYLPAYGTCRTGWWQTLRYGHVRPRWGTWCR